MTINDGRALLAEHEAKARERGPLSLAQLIECAEREVKMRRRVYPGFICRFKMTPEVAGYETAAMAQIARLLHELRHRDQALIEQRDLPEAGG